MEETQNLGNVIKNQRNRLGITLGYLSIKSGVSASYLSRIEKAQRYPSAHILRKIVEPLGLDETELFNLAGYLPGERDKSPDLEKHKLQAELDVLLNRVTADINRIKSVMRELRSKL